MKNNRQIFRSVLSFIYKVTRIFLYDFLPISKFLKQIIYVITATIFDTNLFQFIMSCVYSHFFHLNQIV